jgi:Autographiviridae endonuclease VII
MSISNEVKRERDRLRQRENYQRDPEKARAKSRDWYHNNKERACESIRKSRQKHKEQRRQDYLDRYASDPEFRVRQKAIWKKWVSANPDKRRAIKRAWWTANRKALNAARCAAYRDDPARRDRARQKTAEWHRQNPGRLRASHLKIKYGITVQVFEEMMASQDGRCAICRIEITGKKLCVDHDHETGGIRGLLCAMCNLTLGKFNDDPTRFRTAADYLERHQARLAYQARKSA